MLHQMAAKLRGSAQRLAPLLQKETGYRLENINPGYFEFSAQIIDYFAELARSDIGRVVPSMLYPTEQLDMVIKCPLGVAGLFPPSNYPMVLLFWKLGPALAAGNTVVIKSHPSNPLISLALAEGVFDELPPGVVNIVSGDAAAGRRLVEHPDVPIIAYTGSTGVGSQIASVAGPLQKRLNLELSGSDPAIVTADANLDLAVEAVAYAAFKNGGQICVSTERLFVERSIYEPFIQRLAERASQLTVGPGIDPNTDVTPLRTASLRDKVHQIVSEAVSEGARLLCGGNHSRWSKGFFYPPTVVADCNAKMRIMREEIYGPAVAVTPFDSFDEAIQRANEHSLALGACLYSNDPAKVLRFINGIHAGNIWINDPLMDNVAAPFGGTKGSGRSQELGPEGLEVYRQTKHVTWDTHGRVKQSWFPRR